MTRREEELAEKLRAIWGTARPKRAISRPARHVIYFVSGVSTVLYILSLHIVYQYTQRHAQQPPAPVKAIASPAPVKPAQVKPVPAKVKPAHKPHKHKGIHATVTAKIGPAEHEFAYEGHLDEEIFEVEAPKPPANLKTEKWMQMEEEGDA